MFISLCILCKSKPSDVSVSTVKSLFTDVAVPIICNFGKRFHSGPLFYDFRILLALFSFVPNFSRGSWLQGIVFIFGFRVCIEHILWTWVFKFSRSVIITNIWTSVQYVCSFVIPSSERVCFFRRAGARRWYGRCITQITIEVFLTLLPTGGFTCKQTSEFWHKCDHWHPHWNGMDKLAYACFITGILFVASTSDNWFWTWHLILSGWFLVLWFPHLLSGYCIDQCLQLSSNLS